MYDPSQYRIPRMGSEYGLQSLPSYETLETVYDDADMDYWGDVSEWRQHHPFGEMLQCMSYMVCKEDHCIKSSAARY